METHQIQLPGKILIGTGILEKTSEVCADLGVSGKILLVTQDNLLELTGSRLKDNLSGKFSVWMELVREGSVEEAQRIEEACQDASCIVGTGGGVVNDIGKLVAFSKKLPYVFVPTAPSHDGLASDKITLSSRNGMVSQKAKPPTAIIADIAILKGAPYRLVAAGCADLISNYTAVHDWRLAKKAKKEYFSESSARLALYSADAAVKSSKAIRNREEAGIRTLVKAIISSGIAMSLAGSSRPGSGSEHKFSHALDSLGSKALHGEQAGLGAILMACQQGQNWQKIRESLLSVGAPVTAKEAGISEDMFIEALLKASAITDRYTILNEKPLDRKTASGLCAMTGVL